MSRKALGNVRMAILDDLVQFHARKFVELEARRIQLHARNVNRTEAPPSRMGSAGRQSLLTEIKALEDRLASLKASL